jgi:hypothetical protein
MKVRLDAAGLTLREWIVWHCTFGVELSPEYAERVRQRVESVGVDLRVDQS